MKKGGPEFVKRAPEGLSLFKITPPKASSFFAPRGAMCIGEEGRPMNLEFSHFPSWRTILHPISEANELKLFIMFLVAVIMPDSWDVTRMELEGASEQPKNVEITRKV